MIRLGSVPHFNSISCTPPTTSSSRSNRSNRSPRVTPSQCPSQAQCSHDHHQSPAAVRRADPERQQLRAFSHATMTTATMSAASLLFVIVYNFLYYFLYLVLFAVLVVTPIDLIQQGVQHNRNYDILVIIVSYVATILVVAFIYATRLYISRSVLASIPKQWIPIEKGDVPPTVRQMIVEGLSRSAAIAYEARPRLPLVMLVQEPVAGGSGGTRQDSEHSGMRGLWPSGPKKRAAPAEPAEVKTMELSQNRPCWDEIEHPGWASPTSDDLPNLQYDAVVAELPSLIEAKALTLAPPDPASDAQPPTLDPDAVALLQRPDCMGLREYLAYLTELAVLAPLPTTSEFLALYEAARFSGRPLSAAQFRALMHLFSEMLRNMHPLSRAALARQQQQQQYNGYDDASSSNAAPPSSSESDIDNDAPRGTSPSSDGGPRDPYMHHHDGYNDSDSSLARRRNSSSTASSSAGRLRPGGAGGAFGLRSPASAHTWGGSGAHGHRHFRTAPTTPRSRHTGFSRASSSDSLAHEREHARSWRPYQASLVSKSSSGSARSGASGGGSVIRLAGSEDATDLPYVIVTSESGR